MNLLLKNGSPSRYGLACGYVDRFEKGQSRVTLWREHCCYHVRRFNGETGARLWLSYDLGELGQARAKFRELSREVVR